MVCWHLKNSSRHSSGLSQLNSALTVKILLSGHSLWDTNTEINCDIYSILPCWQWQRVPVAGLWSKHPLCVWSPPADFSVDHCKRCVVLVHKPVERERLYIGEFKIRARHTVDTSSDCTGDTFGNLMIRSLPCSTGVKTFIRCTVSMFIHHTLPGMIYMSCNRSPPLMRNNSRLRTCLFQCCCWRVAFAVWFSGTYKVDSRGGSI